MDMVVEVQKKRKLEEDQNTAIRFSGLKIHSKRIERYKKRRTRRENEIHSATASSPRLPNGVVIRTPAASPTVSVGVLEHIALSTAEDITTTQIPAPSPRLSEYPLSQISQSSERDLWRELYDLKVRTTSTTERISRTTPNPLIQSFPERYSPSQHFNEPLMNQEFDIDLEEFTLLQSSESFQAFDFLSAEWDASIAGGPDIFLRSAFNTTPFAGSNQVVTSTWAGSYSMVLHNVPWMRFQQLIKTPDERRRLLSGLLRSTPGSNDTDILPKFTSLLQELIPESFDGEISNKLQLLFDPSNNYSLYQLTEFALYFLSNNMLAEKQTNEFLEWTIQQKPKGLLRSLFEIKTPTVHAFSSKILESTARIGDANMLQLLIDSGIDISSLAGVSGGRYLQLATLYNRMDVAQLLLENGADIDPPLGSYPYDEPPLHRAAGKGNIDMVRRLVEAGAKIDTCVDGETALSNSVRSGTADCVRLLLEAGADVDDGQIDDHTVLDWAYLNKKDLYRMILPLSRKGNTSLTVSGILCAANRGSRALSQYLNRKETGKDSHGREKLESALCHAVNYFGHSDAVSVLLEFGVDPNVETVDEETPPLVTATMANDINLAQRLLDAGADIDTPDVLATAADGEENFDLLNFLIEQGADVETFGGEALQQAVASDNLAAVKLLLSLGANINDSSGRKRGRTPLQRAAGGWDLKMVKYLINMGAEVNAPPSPSEGLTALQAAAEGGNIEVVRFLLDLGADVNAQPSESEGKTALEASVCWELTSRKVEIFQLLLDKGADINGPRRRRKCRKWNSVLTTLITKSADVKLIQRALSAGADINQPGKGKEARTPIQAAAEIGNLNILKQLLDKGAKINTPPGVEFGRTALQAACSYENPNLELVRFLLDQGAEVNAPAGIKGGLTALQGTAIRGHMKIALMLLEAGAEVNAEPAEIKGRTALDGAAEHGRLDMVQLLLNVGAKSEEPGKTGFDTAIELAEENGHFAVAEILKAHSRRDFEESI